MVQFKWNVDRDRDPNNQGDSTMTEQEYKAWAKHQMKNTGHWTTDPIHSRPDDLLVYTARPDDPTAGVYVHITPGLVEAGKFEGAVPHMGEAIYYPKTQIETPDPLKTAVERLGLSFLLAITHTTSPYRTVAMN